MKPTTDDGFEIPQMIDDPQYATLKAADEFLTANALRYSARATDDDQVCKMLADFAAPYRDALREIRERVHKIRNHTSMDNQCDICAANSQGVLDTIDTLLEAK